MSYFYLTPVKGNLPVHSLELILIGRLEHLKTVSRGDSTVYNEYVVEGSVYDNVGHFLLCIVVVLSEDREFLQFVLKTELELFKHRLTTSSAYELRLFSKKLLSQIKKHKDVPVFVDSLKTLCQHLMLKDLAKHICLEHSTDCTVHNISLSFKQCLPLVAKRQVELKNGVALISCGRWKQLLISLFTTNLKYRLTKIDLTTLKSDPRILELLTKVKNEFCITKKSNNILLNKNVDSTSLFFPPCMLNLHQSLRYKHRLHHSQRFYYSLFLKDIGMPVEEAVEFWKAEYRLHPNGQHSCCHNWEKDEKKFMYGIRHMYGLEGGRKNYSSANCQRIQSMDMSCHEGGCPFKSFDSSKMIPLLKNCSEPLLLQLNELKRKQMYTSACMLFMETSFLKSKKCDSSSFNFTPVKYYEIVSKHNDSYR